MPEPVPRDQPLDVQHDTDPASDHSIARRIPHMGHALLFLALIVACFFFWIVLLALVFHKQMGPSAGMQGKIYVAAASQALAYAMTLAIAFPLFPLLWHRSFLQGISWTWRQARLYWWQLLLAGAALSAGAQLSEHLIKAPKGTEIIELFRNPVAAWLTAGLGGLLVPVFEEIAFRGFLLPAFAIAYDWLSLERTPAARQRWQQTTGITLGAWIFASIVSSALFVALHGSQLHWAYGPLAVLFLPSLVFCFVRVRFQSVAAASLVHVAYDSLIFLEIFISTGAFRHLEKLTN